MSKKFTDLSALTTPATDDLLPIDDISAATTKKITIANLLSTPGAIANNTITAPMLATSAIRLGAATDITVAQNINLLNTDVFLGGYTLSVTIPAGGRSTQVNIVFPEIGCTGPSIGLIKLWTGSVGGTLLQQWSFKLQDSGDTKPFTLTYDYTPAAGAVTFLVSCNANPNNINFNFAATKKGQFNVKTI